MLFTTKELAAKLNISDENAYTLIRFLEAEKVITRAGAKEPEVKRRGKKQYTYNFNELTLDSIQQLLIIRYKTP